MHASVAPVGELSMGKSVHLEVLQTSKVQGSVRSWCPLCVRFWESKRHALGGLEGRFKGADGAHGPTLQHRHPSASTPHAAWNRIQL
eukprot:389303-Pelagomonas_calceolata.AAC.3